MSTNATSDNTVPAAKGRAAVPVPLPPDVHQGAAALVVKEATILDPTPNPPPVPQFDPDPAHFPAPRTAPAMLLAHARDAQRRSSDPRAFLETPLPTSAHAPSLETVAEALLANQTPASPLAGSPLSLLRKKSFDMRSPVHSPLGKPTHWPDLSEIGTQVSISNPLVLNRATCEIVSLPESTPHTSKVLGVHAPL